MGAFFVVATWNPAAASTYYTRQRETEYYAGSGEPPGVWYAPAGDLGVVDGPPSTAPPSIACIMRSMKMALRRSKKFVATKSARPHSTSP